MTNNRIKRSSKQRVWTYIRDNRNFRVGDILLIIEISQNTLSKILRELVRGGYIVKTVSPQKFLDKKFRLVKDVSPLCPLTKKRKYRSMV